MSQFKEMMNATCSQPRCENRARSRTLCSGCYQSAKRAGDLYLYPSSDMINNPDDVARAMFTHYPDNLGDIAIEFGYELVKVTDRYDQPRKVMGDPTIDYSKLG